MKNKSFLFSLFALVCAVGTAVAASLTNPVFYSATTATGTACLQANVTCNDQGNRNCEIVVQTAGGPKSTNAYSDALCTNLVKSSTVVTAPIPPVTVITVPDYHNP